MPLRLSAAGESLLRSWGGRRDAAIEAMLASLPEGARRDLLGGMAQALRGQPRERAHADAACRVCTWPACGADCPVDRSGTPFEPSRGGHASRHGIHG